MATADFLSRQGHNVSVQGVQITGSCDIADGTPQLASIFRADEFRLYQLEDTAVYDVRLAIQNGSKTISSDDSEAHEIFRQKDKLFIGNDGILRIKNFHSRYKCRNQLLHGSQMPSTQSLTALS